MKYIIAMAFLVSGCATQGRHLRPGDSLDREVAMASYGIGGLIGFAGCIAGFITSVGHNDKAANALVPVCIGGWAFGIGGVSYLGWDDHLRGVSYQQSGKQ